PERWRQPGGGRVERRQRYTTRLVLQPSEDAGGGRADRAAADADAGSHCGWSRAGTALAARESEQQQPLRWLPDKDEASDSRRRLVSSVRRVDRANSRSECPAAVVFQSEFCHKASLKR